MAREALEELENDPRPVSAEEAGRLLELTPGQVAALNPPVVKGMEGQEVGLPGAGQYPKSTTQP